MNCEKCGQPLHPGAAFCENCGHSNPQKPAEATPVEAAQPQVELQKPENFVLGTLGALIGAVLGAASIVLFGQLGVISAISGLILAFCTVKGYELLGKRMSIKGIVVCVLLIAVTPYLGNRLDWAIAFQKEFFPDQSITNVFAAVPELIGMDPEVSASYWKNLLMTYAFSALGAFGILRGLFAKKK